MMTIRRDTFLGQLIIALARSSPAFSGSTDTDDMGVGLLSALVRSSEAFTSVLHRRQDRNGRRGGSSGSGSDLHTALEPPKTTKGKPADSDGPGREDDNKFTDGYGVGKIKQKTPQRRRFGTDGVRGNIGGSLTPELCMRVAQCAYQTLQIRSGEERRNIVVVGRDPRAGSQQLESWIVDGLVQSGANPISLGVLPTAAIARFVRAREAVAGIAISAGDDPMPRNGIKIFGADGRKLDDETEARIEELLDNPGERRIPASLGRPVHLDNASEIYVQELLGNVPVLGLKGLRIVVDCANGSASGVAARCYTAAGAETILINAGPNGQNINQSWHPGRLDALRAAVVDNRADAGIAHDGGADRCLAVDENGRIVDGDQIIAILALAMRDRNELSRNTVVVSEMSNLGLQNAMEQAGIRVVTTSVGDRYISQTLLREGYSLGGEQSGHILIPELSTVGDGMLTALKLLECLNESERPLSDLATIVRPIPQFTEDVHVVDKRAISESATIQRALAKARDVVGKEGRVVVRASGTEDVVRIMAQARTTDAALTTVGDLALLVGEASGL